MPELARYTSEELPAVLLWQIRSFIRTVWPTWREEPDNPVTAPEWHPTHFVLHDGELLLAHAAVTWKLLGHGGASYKTFGLSGVFTFPAQRGKGYGAQVVDAATALIDGSDGDIAILFTGPEVIDFYVTRGWVHMPNMTVLTGDPDHPDDFSIVAMMRFGRAKHASFATARLYFGRNTW